MALLEQLKKKKKKKNGGGMAVVFLAEDLKHHRPVAIGV